MPSSEVEHQLLCNVIAFQRCRYRQLYGQKAFILRNLPDKRNTFKVQVNPVAAMPLPCKSVHPGNFPEKVIKTQIDDSHLDTGKIVIGSTEQQWTVQFCCLLSPWSAATDLPAPEGDSTDSRMKSLEFRIIARSPFRYLFSVFVEDPCNP